ncbi:Outer membrane protein (porin) [Roseateles sp. YR242]|uniref:porin n=1 Tax=Roseateles sp. YR242 TaxID=1855305 RepID=UPI0008C5E399|nr:porin [Roseateles sp. YR242]SEK83533.1 Outer membrane protein (porin) [Roseateles sp. YR242]
MKNRLKRSALIAATLLCAALSAAAQTSTTNVTLYGLLDLYGQYGKGNANSFALQSGGLSGSRLGVRGNEDLGGGLSAFFTMEHGVAADTGTVTQGGVFWGRQLFVGLGSKDWGAVMLGRPYTPHFFASVANDIFGTGAGSGYASGVLTTIFRADNAVTYELPKIAGTVTGSIMQTAGEGGIKSSSGHLRYADGPLAVSAAYLQRATAEKLKVVTLAGSYDFDVVKFVVGWQDVKNLTGAVGARDDRREFWLQAAVPVSVSGTVQLGVADAKARGVSGKDASQWSAAYVHALSKRTSLYTTYSKIENQTATAYTTSAATGTGPAVSAGVDASALTVGIRHSF